MDVDSSIDQAAKMIREADRLLIGAGAGMGVDSGLPDFRGNEGFWNAYPPFRDLGLSFYDLANPIWFRSNPEQAWGFYGHRLNLYRETQPHRGFAILSRWCEDRFVFTSNVDGHFLRSRFPEDRVCECHGSIHHLQCINPSCDAIWLADDVAVDVDETTFLARDPLPTCPHCDAIARPNILMFGDGDWLAKRTDAQHHRYQSWLRRGPVVGIEIGAGTAVPTVRFELEHRTRESRCGLIRINPRESRCEQGVSIPMGALEALERIDEAIVA